MTFREILKKALSVSRPMFDLYNEPQSVEFVNVSGEDDVIFTNDLGKVSHNLADLDDAKHVAFLKQTSGRDENLVIIGVTFSLDEQVDLISTNSINAIDLDNNVWYIMFRLNVAFDILSEEELFEKEKITESNEFSY